MGGFYLLIFFIRAKFSSSTSLLPIIISQASHTLVVTISNLLDYFPRNILYFIEKKGRI